MVVPGTGLVAQMEPEEIQRICDGLEDSNRALCELLAPIVPSEFLTRVIAILLPTAAKIVLILVVAWVLHRLVRRAIRRFVTGLTEQGIERLAARNKGPLASTRPINLQRATMRTETIGGVLRSIASVAIWTVAILMILGEFRVELGPLIAGAGILGIALGFGSQKLVQDFLAGIFMILEDQFGVGDIIDAGEATGVVEAIGLRTTRVRDVHGTMWHIPNGTIARVGNFSQEWSRALLDVPVAYATDLGHSSEVIERVACELAQEGNWAEKFVEPPEVWGVQDFGSNEIAIRLVMKVVPAQQWAVEREMRRRLKDAFDKEGIEIPFPQRTVWHRYEDGKGPADADDGTARPQRGVGRAQEGSWGPAQRPP
jgi:moderate conductance mechanosensitive channel